MCGYACIGCGRCKGLEKAPDPVGTCVICKTVNEPGTEFCVNCGALIPKPAGQPSSVSSPADSNTRAKVAV